MALETWDIDAIIERSAKVKTQIENMRDEIESLKRPLGKIQPYLPYKDPGGEYYKFGEDARNRYVTPSQEAEKKKYESILATYQSDLETAKKNAEIFAENGKLLKRCVDMIIATGIPKEYSKTEWRGRSHKNVTVTAEWANYLHAPIPKLSVRDVEDRIRNLNDAYKKYTEAIVQKVRDEKMKVEATEKERQKMAVMAEVALYLGKDPVTADFSELMDALRVDKYLDLASAMEDTRGDWSDGFYRVENALGRFTAETDVDKRIAESLSELVWGDERDGRIFRDCEYNYSVLYGMADAKLYELFAKLSQYSNRY